MISKPLFIFALLALAIPCLRAQDDVDTGRYFRTVGAGVTTTALYFSHKGKDKNISIADGYRSLLYDGKGTGKLVFYTISTGPDGKQVDTTVAQADISEAGTLALLTFSPDPNAPGTYQVQVLPDDLTTFPLGSYRVVNRSSLPVTVKLGAQTADVAPNENRLIVYPTPPKGTCILASVYASGTGSPRLLYANTWAYKNNYRTEILVSPRPGNTNFVSVNRLLDNPTVLLMKQFLPKD